MLQCKRQHVLHIPTEHITRHAFVIRIAFPSTVPRTPPSLVAQRGIQLDETQKKKTGKELREEKRYRMALRKRKHQEEKQKRLRTQNAQKKMFT